MSGIMQAVKTGGITVKQLFPIDVAVSGDNALKAEINSLETPAEPVDRKVTGKHAAVDPKDVDCTQDDLPVIGGYPGQPCTAKTRDLNRNIGL